MKINKIVFLQKHDEEMTVLRNDFARQVRGKVSVFIDLNWLEFYNNLLHRTNFEHYINPLQYK